MQLDDLRGRDGLTSLWRGLLGVALLALAVRQGVFAVAMLGTSEVASLLLCTLEAAFAGIAGFGVLWNRDWAPLALLVAGAWFALTALVQALILEIRPALSGLLDALVAFGIGLAAAVWLTRSGGAQARTSNGGSHTVKVAPR